MRLECKSFSNTVPRHAFMGPPQVPLIRVEGLKVYKGLEVWGLGLSGSLRLPQGPYLQKGFRALRLPQGPSRPVSSETLCVSLLKLSCQLLRASALPSGLLLGRKMLGGLGFPI